jgi:tyrosine-protein phosphatase YwqE
MENYMFQPDKIKEKCFELNRAIDEKGLELNVVPGQHISEKYVAGYHIGIHKNLEEPPISSCYVSFEL